MNWIKKSKNWLIPLVILLVFGFTIRSCFHKKFHEHIYYIARDNSWYPLRLMGKERNLTAFTDDLLAIFVRESGLKIHVVDTASDTLQEGLDNGTFDAILSVLSPTDVNKEKYLFSELILELGLVLIMPENVPFASLADLEGKTIGVENNSWKAYEAITRNINSQFQYVIIPYDSPNKALDALSANLIDAVILDTVPAYVYTEGLYAGRLRVVSVPLGDEGLRLIAKKGFLSQKFIDEFNQILKKLQADGTYDQFLEKWNLLNPQKRYLEYKTVE